MTLTPAWLVMRGGVAHVRDKLVRVEGVAAEDAVAAPTNQVRAIVER